MLARTRLFARIDAARTQRALWITGPPGAGKTTLASSYIQERKLRALWYQLDEGDGDIASFFHYLGLSVMLADFFGFLTPTIEAAVLSFPPTIILHNKHDQIVYVSNSKKLNELLPSTIDYEFVTYDERWQIVNHAFEPGGTADVDSRSKTTAWFTKYLPPTGN